ncbi:MULTISPECIES: DMT family transporter [Pseudomonas]|uniref:DMT family permease n=1 Tax=Pseudomonas luteola TaxID=47886 RepID=A0A2X2DHG9_PSELU|nr:MULTISPECIES: DMT family transporter [Pseudomonas]ENA36079.1 hypothetical protein HMPREF1487_05443 [Pseudomonas sp. HPB0071]MBF8641850.1 DMT family transporter [Pseudomonas zeshuii]RRW48605.1 DMT family transporter [Pseudomonas luteola]SHI93628.1 Threonine/homoserine efflux transporter RhtA [Pseudomonas zeshuii]SPZ11645.1 DMT family permease [Pseudomonas luteola]
MLSHGWHLAQRPAWLADISLLLVAVVWGSSYSVAKTALLLYPVLGFLAIRFCLTALLLLPQLRGEGRKAIRPGLPLGLMLLAIFLCETFGVAQTTASKAAFLISLFVIFTPLLEWVLLGQRPARGAFLAAAVSLLGILLLTGEGAGELQFNLGDALMVAAAALRALMMCVTKRYFSTQAIPALALTAVQAAVAGLGCLVMACLLPAGLPALPVTYTFWLATGYLVVFCTLFAFVVQIQAIRYSSPTRISLLMGTEPVFGALFAVLWLQESLSVQGWIGGFLIVATAIWATRLRSAAV